MKDKYTTRIHDVDMNFDPHIGVVYIDGKADLFSLQERKVIALMEFSYEDSGNPIVFSLDTPLDESLEERFAEMVVAELEHWLCAWWAMDFYVIEKMAMVLWNDYGVVSPETK